VTMALAEAYRLATPAAALAIVPDEPAAAAPADA